MKAENARGGILAGYKVLDFTQIVAGPTATKLMAGRGNRCLLTWLLGMEEEAWVVTRRNYGVGSFLL